MGIIENWLDKCPDMSNPIVRRKNPRWVLVWELLQKLRDTLN